jgi:hypothetical protein
MPLACYLSFLLVFDLPLVDLRFRHADDPLSELAKSLERLGG